MAVNKRKVLDAARKYVQKGAKEKALREYERLLKLDPRDGRLRLEIGDAHRRWGQIEEAISQYVRVAEQYQSDGFEARAVAVYKQVLNLDPKRYASYEALAELYQRMGLDAEAVNALQTAADGYHKDGQKREALELLRKMAALDPTNTTSRLKVADLLRQEGLEDEAVSEYEAVLEELVQQEAHEIIGTVYERVLEIRPDRVDMLVGLARNLVVQGKPERAEPFAQRALDKDPEEANHYEVLCDVYKALDRSEDLADVTRRLAKLYRDRGDDQGARQIMQRLPSNSLELNPDESEDEAVSFGDPASLDEGDDELLEDEFLSTDDDVLVESSEVSEVSEVGESEDEELESPEGDPEQLFAEASVYLRYGKRAQAVASLKAILTQEPEHRGALEKLGEAHAEGGEGAEAVAVWTRAAEVASTSGDAGAFEILRDRIAAIDGQAASLLAGPAGSEAAAAEPEATPEPELEEELGFEESDTSEIEIDLGPESAPSETPSAQEISAADSETQATSDEAGIEIDLDDEGFEEPLSEDDDTEVSEVSAAEVASESSPEVFDLDIDVEDDADDLSVEDDEDQADDLEIEDGASEADEIAIGDDESEADEIAIGDDEGEVDEISIDDDESEADDIAIDVGAGDADESGDEADDIEIDLARDEPAQDELSEPAAAKPAPANAAGLSSTASQQIAEDLEEAEFYFQQGLHDEAEAIYQRILEAAPSHPSALLRLGELAAARGEDPASASAPTLSEPDAGSQPGPDTTLDIDIEAVDEAELDVVADGEVSAAEVGEGEALVAEDALSTPTLDHPAEDEEAEVVEAAQEEAVAAASAEVVEEVEAPSEPPPEELEVLVAEGEDVSGDPVDPADDPGSPLAAEQTQPLDAGDTFDLAAELRDAFEDAERDDPNEASGVLSTVDDGFAAIFSEFKKGVSQTLAEGDYETRYDLGIAYREMGLLEDAIAEFRVCLESEGRMLQSLSMMGVCALELGRAQDAVNHFEQALSTEGLANENRVGLSFDLGRAYEMLGDVDRARSAFALVRELDASFPGLHERLAGLEEGRAGPGDSASGDSAACESFDEVSAEAEEGETFESFDDVITEAEALDDEVPEAVIEAEPEPEPEPAEGGSEDESSGTRSGKRGSRKKKISFL